MGPFVLFFLASLGVVGFGQPGWIAYLAPCSAIFGYAFFWRSLECLRSRWLRFWTGVAWFSLVQSIQLSWMTATEYQGAYIIVIYLALCLWLGLQFGATVLLLPVSQAISIPRMLAIASLVTLIEWGRLHFLCGFSWNPAGLALTGYLPSVQLASVWGVLGLSFWVILTNLFSYRLFKYKIRSYGVWLAIVLFPYLFGFFQLTFYKFDSKEESERILSIALVQTGLLPPEKIPLARGAEMFISPYEQWRRIIGFLKEKNQKTFDLIVLPESAVPFNAEFTIYFLDVAKKIIVSELGPAALTHLPPLSPPFAALQLRDETEVWMVSNAFWAQVLANFFESEVVAGLDIRDLSYEGAAKHYNAAVHFAPGLDRFKNRYEKRVLVPLAEYLPFKFLRSVVGAYGISEFFTHGQEAKVFSGKFPFATSICYEETFSHLIREGRVKGAELLVNLTNDSWYPFSRLPLQHFHHGRLRSVENGVPLIRACNTGLTAVVDCFGRTLDFFGKEAKESSDRAAGVLTVALPMHQFKTLYSWWGDSVLIGGCLFLFTGFLLFKKKFSW